MNKTQLELPDWRMPSSLSTGQLKETHIGIFVLFTICFFYKEVLYQVSFFFSATSC